MTVKQHFNKIYYEEFTDLAMLNDFECKVLKLRIKGETIVGIAMKLNCHNNGNGKGIEKRSTFCNHCFKQRCCRSRIKCNFKSCKGVMCYGI